MLDLPALCSAGLQPCKSIPAVAFGFIALALVGGFCMHQTIGNLVLRARFETKALPQITRYKFEARNPKTETIPNDKNSNDQNNNYLLY